MRKLALSLAVSALAIAAPAQAVIFTIGNNPQPGEQTIEFADAASVTAATGSGNVTATNMLTVTGTTTSGSSFSVSGNVIAPTTGDILGITITPNSPLTALIFNPTNGPGSNLTVNVTTNLSLDTFMYSLGVGNNFLTITTTPGEVIQNVVLADGVGFQDLREIRAVFAPTNDGGVPEPATWAMMLLGFGAMGIAMRHRRTGLAATA